MNRPVIAIITLAALSAVASGEEEFFDELDQTLSVSTSDGAFRARLSGTLDLEGYHFSQPAPALIDADGSTLFNPRLSLFLDAQLGSHFYLFAQARVDRGFDPESEELEGRLDEYALRFTPWLDGRFNVQIGKFATVVGNWVQRHGSWDNPFVSAPLPYENLTGLWDAVAVNSATTLLAWAHVRPQLVNRVPADDKYLRLPIIWGPSYTSGLAVSGELGRTDYAMELKGTALSSRPATWDTPDFEWRHPTISGRVGYRPNEMWNFGVSASDGPYLRPSAEPTLRAGERLGDYRETVFAQDAGFAWHHLQAWAEIYEARFTIPRVGNADTTAYYVETKYKFTPQFFGAVRWNQQWFGTIPLPTGGSAHWGGKIWRIDVAPGYRFTPQTELKFQYSLQHDELAVRNLAHLFALQFVVRF